MMFKNKQFFILIICFFALITGLQSQTNTLDLLKANQLLSIAQERDRVSAEALEEVKSQRLRLEEDLNDLQGQLSASVKTEKKKLEAEVKVLRKKEVELLTKRKYATNLLLDVTDILQASEKKRATFIKEYEKRFGPIKTEGMAMNQEAIKVAPPSVEKQKSVDPVAQLESQSSNQPLPAFENDAVDETPTEPKSKKKKESTNKSKTDKNAITPRVVSNDSEPKSKKKKETTKKPKTEIEPSSETITATEANETQGNLQSKIETKPKKATKSKTAKVVKPEVKVSESEPSGDIFALEPVLSQTEKKPKREKKVESAKVTKPSKTVSKSEAQSENIAVMPEPQHEVKQKKKETKATTEKLKTTSSKSSINYKKYDPKEDVMINSPSNLNCNLAFDGIDNFTGKKKQETMPIVLFAHTDDFMRATMKNKDFVTCEATATRIEGSRTVYINLTITIQSKDAQRTFGFLDRGAMIIFRFINGKRVSLATNKTDIGAVDVDKGTTTFRAQLAILETVELTASELDAVRVSWSIGYEDYEIFDMEVLRNLFKCLDKK